MTPRGSLCNPCRGAFRPSGGCALGGLSSVRRVVSPCHHALLSPCTPVCPCRRCLCSYPRELGLDRLGWRRDVAPVGLRVVRGSLEEVRFSDLCSESGDKKKSSAKGGAAGAHSTAKSGAKGAESTAKSGAKGAASTASSGAAGAASTASSAIDGAASTASSAVMGGASGASTATNAAAGFAPQLPMVGVVATVIAGLGAGLGAFFL